MPLCSAFNEARAGCCWARVPPHGIPSSARTGRRHRAISAFTDGAAASGSRAMELPLTQIGSSPVGWLAVGENHPRKGEDTSPRIEQV